MQQPFVNDIEVRDVNQRSLSVHIGETGLFWHSKSFLSMSVSPRGEIVGHCLFTDIVFCHYRHKAKEVTVLALPRKRSHKVELRERVIQRFSFFSPVKTIITPDMIANPAYYIYKHLHHMVMNEYKRNTEAIIQMNRRFCDSQEALDKLQKQLAVNPSQSILGSFSHPSYHPELYNGRKVFVVLNPHGGNTHAMAVGFACVDSVDLGGYCETLLRPSQSALRFPDDKLRVVVPSSLHCSGHAEDLGVAFDSSLYDSVLFIRFRLVFSLTSSGDGTVNEFINGVLSRPDARSVLFATTFGSISAGTQNSLSRGMGTSCVYTALYCLAKRKARLFDAICVENGRHVCRYAFCGCGWGIISDMVQDYEKYRFLKQYRYWWLKGYHGCLCKRRHYCSYRFIKGENQMRMPCNHVNPDVNTCDHSDL